MKTATKKTPAEVNHAAPADKTPSPRIKFQDARKALCKAFVERDDEVDLVLTALIAQHHVLLIGEPGVAKSLIVDSVREWISGAKRCVVHCCKDTTRGMAFGPTDLQSLKEKHQRRVLDGGAADAHILILEEVFKSGPAVLDMFLLVMNERIYKEGVFSAKTPLRLLLGVSNEWSPEGCEAALAAFFDRFLFRKKVNPVSPVAGRKALLARAVAGDKCRPTFTDNITVEEIDIAHAEAEALPWSADAKRALWEILEQLGKEGINPGDRRTMQAVSAARAAAYLAGGDEVRPEHLEVLQHVLWTDPEEQPAKCAAVVCRIANPLSMRVNDLRRQAEDVSESQGIRWGEVIDVREKEGICGTALSKLKEVKQELSILAAGARRDAAAQRVEELLREWNNRLIGRRE